MSKILRSKFGFSKHWLIASVFLLGCYIPVSAEPISITTILVGLAVSAATTAASALLAPLFAPKPKPIDKNKLQGDLSVSNVGEDLDMVELYGKRQDDGLGGMELGVVYFYISQIRKVVVPTETARQGSGKGGSSKKTQTENVHKYYVDIAGMVGQGDGRIRCLELRANTDVLYKNYPPVSPTASGVTKYEGEAGTLGGGASVISDAEMSGGQGVQLDDNETVTFSHSGDDLRHQIFIHYKNNADQTLKVTVDGRAQTIVLPDADDNLDSVMVIGDLANGATSIVLESESANIRIDKIVVGLAVNVPTYIPDFPTPYEYPQLGINGLENPNWINSKLAYNAYTFDVFDPLESEQRPIEQFNYQIPVDSQGSTVANLPDGAELRFYQGTADQMPDPLLQMHFESKYGAGATPAFRHRPYFVLENFEITPYRSVPNITGIWENLDIHTLGDMYKSRVKRTGLEDAEIDFTALEAIPLRGYPISRRQAPKTEMENLNRLFDVDVFEGNDGILRGVVPDETVKATIPIEDLDIYRLDGTESKKTRVPVEEVIKDEYEVAEQLDMSFFDPRKDFEVRNVHPKRQVSVSAGRENFETGLVLLEEECQALGDRELQKMWAEKDAMGFSTFYKYGHLQPTDLIEVEHKKDEFDKIRLKGVQGNIPGILKMSSVSRNLPEPIPRIFQVADTSAKDVRLIDVPGHVLGTIIDEAVLRTSQTTPGFHVVGCMTDQSYKWKGAGLFWETEGNYELLKNLPLQGTIGKTISGGAGNLGDVPGGWEEGDWDDTSSLTFDLYNGEVETLTDAKILDGHNLLMVGKELIAFRDATRVNGYPNRWTIDRLRRRLKDTGSTTHASNERVVLMNDAVEWVDVDISEYNNSRDYKFVASGQNIDSASKFSFTWDGPFVDSQDGTGRSRTAIDPNGKFRGQDTAIVPTSAIAIGEVDSVIVEQNVVARININCIDLGATHNQTDSADLAEVKVYNQFGELIKTDEIDLSKGKGNGMIIYPRAYADAADLQAYFCIKIINYYGPSQPVYVRGATQQLTPFTALVRTAVPTELGASPISDSEIQIVHNSPGNINMYRRDYRIEGDWELHESGISAASHKLENMAEFNKWEFQARLASDETKVSNIVRADTKQIGSTAPSYPQPSAPALSLGTNPQTQINASWSRIATDNDNVEVWVDGVLAHTEAGTAESKTLTVTAGQTIGVKLRNKWTTGPEYSEFTTEAFFTSQAASGDERPEITWISYDEGTNTITVNWANDTGNGPFSIEYKVGVSGTIYSATTNHTSPLTSYDMFWFPEPVAQTVYFRVKDNDITSPSSGWSDWDFVYIPAEDLPGCFLDGTAIDLSGGGTALIEEAYFGQKVIGHDDFGNLYETTVVDTSRRKVNKILEVYFEGKSEPTWVTPEHPYRQGPDYSFKEIGEFDIGEKIVSRDQTRRRIQRSILGMRVHEGEFWVNNLTCQPYPNYIANDDEVHNKSE